MNILDDKVILLTGGTGSFGNKFTEIVLRDYKPEVIRIFSRGEKKQLDMKNKFNDSRLRFFIGDVRDKDRLHRSMSGVDIVVHAAALKQVPACEYNPIEAIRTNIDGAINVIDTSIDNDVKHVLFVSTDKAVHPVNMYGSTKMASEKLFIQANSYSGFSGTKFSCIRYGNVIGSRGSVVPLFLEQKKKGIITITNKKMTRFWITLEQGVKFVINSIDKMIGGEIFVPKIPSMKIIDLANAIAPNAKIKIIGIRPGEKIHEILLTDSESKHSKEFDEYFTVEPEDPLHRYWKQKKRVEKEEGKILSENFSYTSYNNKRWIAKEDILELILE